MRWKFLLFSDDFYEHEKSSGEGWIFSSPLAFPDCNGSCAQIRFAKIFIQNFHFCVSLLFRIALVCNNISWRVSVVNRPFAIILGLTCEVTTSRLIRNKIEIFFSFLFSVSVETVLCQKNIFFVCKTVLR